MRHAFHIGDEDRLLGESRSPIRSLMAGQNDVLARPYPTPNASSFRDSRSKIGEQCAAGDFHLKQRHGRDIRGAES